jgi:hypothetical protein
MALPPNHDILLVGIGIVFQSVTLATAARAPQKFLLIFAFLITSLLAFMPGRDETIYNFSEHLICYFILYMFIFSVAFSQDILPIINENSLLLFNIIFLTNVINFYLPMNLDLSDLSNPLPVLLDILLIPSIIVLVNAFLPYSTPKWMKVMFYIWYLMMTASILGTSIYYYATRANMLEDDSLLSIITLFTFGMVMLSLFLDLFRACPQSF